MFLGFAGPAVSAFLFVIGWAFVNGVFMSFTDWNGISESYNMVGISNYVKAVHDVNFWESLGRTAKYVVGVVILVNLVAFFFAFLLTRGYKGQGIFRTGFFVPNLIGGVVLGIVWKFIFSEALVQLGNAGVFSTFADNWLSAPDTAMLAMIIVAVWQQAGYLMIIYMAGIIAVPESVCEAASLDGATGLYAVRKIIFPLVMPAVTICTFLSVKAAFMVYDVNLTLTAGGPFKLTIMASMHVYNKAFKYNDFGIGQAEAIILFLIVAVISVIQVTITKNREVVENALALPQSLNVSALGDAFHKMNYGQTFLNSLFITLTSVSATIAAAAMCAYLFARKNWRVNHIIFMTMVVSMIIPFQTIMIPLVRNFSSLGIMNNRGTMIFFYVGANVPMAVFMFHGFMKSIPFELEEAAKIDGCTQVGIFVRIILPLLRPIASTVFILNFLGTWNDFLAPFIILTDNSKKTLPLMTYMFTGQYFTDYALVLAGLILTMLPILAVYIFMQRNIIEGVAQGAVKG